MGSLATNAFALLAAVVGVMTATSATHHRVWEHFMTLEPAHGPAHLNQPVTMKSSYFHVVVQFPDGRNWSSRLDVSTPNWITMLTGTEKVTAVLASAGYLEGTNWVSVARSYRDVIGIQNDGSLWVSVSELPKREPRRLRRVRR
jgi:hypothetical protein